MTQQHGKSPSGCDGYVYFITNDVRDVVKIGHTSGHPSKRQRQLQTGSPCALSVLAYGAGTKRDERTLHSAFERYRVRGEWFLLCDEVEVYVDSIMKCGAPHVRDLMLEQYQ